jgi:hypothetical protein
MELNYRKQFELEQEEEKERIRKEKEKTKVIKETLSKDQIFYKYNLVSSKLKSKLCIGILEIPVGKIYDY